MLKDALGNPQFLPTHSGVCRLCCAPRSKGRPSGRPKGEWTAPSSEECPPLDSAKDVRMQWPHCAQSCPSQRGALPCLPSPAPEPVLVLAVMESRNVGIFYDELRNVQVGFFQNKHPPSPTSRGWTGRPRRTVYASVSSSASGE